MALSKSAGGATTKSVYVNSASAGSGSTFYTVPDGKVFKGYLHINTSAQILQCYVNGLQLNVYAGGTYGNVNPIPFTFPPQTVLVNGSANYVILTGELVDGS